MKYCTALSKVSHKLKFLNVWVTRIIKEPRKQPILFHLTSGSGKPKYFHDNEKSNRNVSAHTCQINVFQQGVFNYRMLFLSNKNDYLKFSHFYRFILQQPESPHVTQYPKQGDHKQHVSKSYCALSVVAKSKVVTRYLCHLYTFYLNATN